MVVVVVVHSYHQLHHQQQQQQQQQQELLAQEYEEKIQIMSLLVLDRQVVSLQLVLSKLDIR